MLDVKQFFCTKAIKIIINLLMNKQTNKQTNKNKNIKVINNKNRMENAKVTYGEQHEQHY